MPFFVPAASIRQRALLAVVACTGILAMAACAPAPAPAPLAESTAFNAADFYWSGEAGTAGIDGTIDHVVGGTRFACTGSVGLTPVTPYTRARFQTLYGSTEKAALPESVVRARTVPDPNADYRSYVRSSTCTDNRFQFSDLPDGDWFLIAPVAAEGSERVVLMQRVRTRGGARLNLTL